MTDDHPVTKTTGIKTRIFYFTICCCIDRRSDRRRKIKTQMLDVDSELLDQFDEIDKHFLEEIVLNIEY